MYEGIAISNQFDKGRKSGQISFTNNQIIFQWEDQQRTWNLSQVRISAGGSNNSLIYFYLNNEEDFTLYSREKSILKDPALTEHPHTSQQLREVKSFFRKHKSIFLGTIGLCVLTLVTLFMMRGHMAKSIASAIPASYERELGDKLQIAATAGKTVIEDSSLYNDLQLALNPLLAVLDTQTFKFTFKIIDDPTPNAFALPGGHIVLHSGMILKAQAWDEVQGVLAHEIAHVTERHHIRGIISNIGFFGILTAFVGDASIVFNTLMSVGSTLETMSYSRDHESEADAVGWDYLVKANINPEGLIFFFARLDDGHDHGGLDKAMNYFSTHPLPQDRVEVLNQQLEELGYREYSEVDVDFEDYKSRLRSQVLDLEE